jgi:hypothetical protein
VVVVVILEIGRSTLNTAGSGLVASTHDTVTDTVTCEAAVTYEVVVTVAMSPLVLLSSGTTTVLVSRTVSMTLERSVKNDVDTVLAEIVVFSVMVVMVSVVGTAVTAVVSLNVVHPGSVEVSEEVVEDAVVVVFALSLDAVSEGESAVVAS